MSASPSHAASRSSTDEFGERVSEGVQQTVREHPWIETLAKLGWLAKGVVYVLISIVAITIAQHQPSNDDASPQGALGVVAEQPFGPVLLLVVTAGLLLYVAWRVLSIVVKEGHGLKEWAARVGYTISVLFYLSLAWTAARAALTSDQPKEGNSVERASRWALEQPGGRFVLGLAGLVTIGVGVFFIVRQSLMRGFVGELDGVDRSCSANRGTAAAICYAGIVGWFGRGLVTCLIGFFVTRAAVQFDPEDASGFDRALRKAAESTTGTILVWIAALGLLAYGLYCIAGTRRRSLEHAAG